MSRTTSSSVQGVLGQDYDGTTSLTPYIDSATIIVDRVSSCSTAKGITLSATELEMIERWLSAHFYTKMDPTYQSKSNAGASGGFVRNPECPEPYKDAAISLDYSGCLKAILSRSFAGGFWAGKPASQQIPYQDRD